MTEGGRVGRPFAIARSDQIGNHTADIDLLSRVIVRTCVVSSYRHRPGLMPVMEVAEELGGVLDIAARIEHGIY